MSMRGVKGGVNSKTRTIPPPRSANPPSSVGEPSLLDWVRPRICRYRVFSGCGRIRLAKGRPSRKFDRGRKTMQIIIFTENIDKFTVFSRCFSINKTSVSGQASGGSAPQRPSATAAIPATARSAHHPLSGIAHFRHILAQTG